MSHHLLGTAEIAELLNVSRQRVTQIRSTYPDFPEPEVELAAGNIWGRTAIEAWVAAHPEPRGGRKNVVPDRDSAATKQVLGDAENEARSLGQSTVTSAPMVFGLLRLGRGAAFEVLREAGLEVTLARGWLRDRIPADGTQREWLIRSDELLAATERAQACAFALGAVQLEPEHLLVGSAREGCHGRQLLTDAGVHAPQLLVRLMERLHAAGGEALWWLDEAKAPRD